MEPFADNDQQRYNTFSMWNRESIKGGFERAVPYVVAVMVIAMVIFVPMTIVAYNRSMVQGPQGNPGVNGTQGEKGEPGDKGENGIDGKSIGAPITKGEESQ